MEVIITCLIFVIVIVALWYVIRYLPEPMQGIARVIVIVGALLWLILNLREIIHAIAGCCRA